MFFSQWFKWLKNTFVATKRAGCRPIRRNRFRPECLLLEDRLAPAVFTPTTTSDLAISSLGVVNSAGEITDQGNAITLRSAVIAANATSGPDTIVLTASQTYTLSQIGNDGDSLTGDLDINDSLTINGNNAIIQGATDAAFTDSIQDKIIGIDEDGFYPDLTVSIDDVVIRYGHNEVPFGDPSFAFTGGGVDVFLTGSDNNISFTNVTIDHNQNVSSYGGGVNIDSANGGVSAGTVTFTNCTISDNQANGFGGGINLYADVHDVIISGCTIQNNVASGGGGEGGGINIRHTNGGTVTIDDTLIDGNTGELFGGGIDFQAPGNQITYISDTTISNNISTGDGGGIAVTSAGAAIQMTGGAITGNSAMNNGGGIFVSDAFIAALSRIIITGNQANSDSAGGGDGGAAFVSNTGTLSVNFSRITGNIANAGGVGTTGTTGISNITATTVDATNNWWGAEANPGVGGTDKNLGSVNASPRLHLALTAATNPVGVNQTSASTADFTHNSLGALISTADLVTLIGLPITFSATGGTISGADATIQSNGQAAATYNAGATTGNFSASAQVDNLPAATTAITIQQPNVAPLITSANNTTFTVGTAGSFTVTTGPHFPAAETISTPGPLPGGVTFVDNGNGTATLSGTPAAATGGIYTFTITASNGVSPDATQSFTLTVNEAPSITSANNTTFTVGTAGSFTVTTVAHFPVAETISETGALPSGVTFVDNGNGTATLSGTPAAATGGVYVITITASNGVSPNATQSFTLTVNEAPSITSANSTTFKVGTAGTFTVTTGPHFPTAETISETGALPSGVTFVDNGNGTATLSGTPASGTAGTYPIVITASNGVLPNATQNFTLIVANGIGLLLLNPNGSGALSVTGNGNITVNGGSIVVDSTSASAINLTGNATVSAAEIDVTGGTHTTGNSHVVGPVHHSAATSDPIALGLPPAPSTTFAAVNYSGNAPLILSPGTYIGGIHITGKGNVTLLPGVYYMQGGGFSVTGSGSVTGTGVLLINAPQSAGDTISLTGKGNIALSASSSLTGVYAAYNGIAMFQTPTSSAAINLTGQGSLTLTGALYAPRARLNITGQGGLLVNRDTASGLAQVIVYEATVTGNGGLTINV